jgi:hypothetical protein
LQHSTSLDHFDSSSYRALKCPPVFALTSNENSGEALVKFGPFET